MRERKIIHIDMDCFYAAVEEKFNPALRGKPVAVGGPANSRSVICTANYEARKYKVKAAIPSSRAVRLCPQLILVPPNFSLYKAESRKVRAIFEQYTDKIEPLSLDEAYLDVTDARRLGEEFSGSATLLAAAVRKQIAGELGLAASAGIAANKFLAKIASDWKKPNGQFSISPGMVEGFMPGLPVEKIWGVGKVTAERMHQLNLFTCGDLQRLSVADLRRHFGESRAQELFQLCRGLDQREVCTRGERKSLSVEETFSSDLRTFAEIRGELPELYDEWLRRFYSYSKPASIRGIVIKLKFADFSSMTHERATHAFPKLEDFLSLAEAAWSRRREPIRLLGVGVRLKDAARTVESAQLELLSV